MDGGGGPPRPNHMIKRIFDIFVEDLLAVLPIAAIATALNILFCLTLPPFFAIPLCGFCSYLVLMASILGSNIGYMFRGFPIPYERWKPLLLEGIFSGLLIVLGLTAYGAAYRKLGIVGIDFELSNLPKKRMSNIIKPCYVRCVWKLPETRLHILLCAFSASTIQHFVVRDILSIPFPYML
jgi:hypothetical protein